VTQPPQPLSDIAIQRELGSLPGWARRGDALVKTFALPSFRAAIEMVRRVADAAEDADHYPDLDVRQTKLVVTLTSHDAGGVTRQDVELARAIERVVSR
jgi:4a-hydroxytetrahydrobiopterin dehydratase